MEEKGTHASAMDRWGLYRVRLVGAGVYVSVFVATDLLLNFSCAFWPFIFYVGAAALGARKAPALNSRYSGKTPRSRFVRRLGVGVAVFSAAGLVILSAAPVNWDSKCAWRHCGRAFGVGLMKSPFPVGTPTCSAWRMCANEYRMSEGQYSELLRRMDKQGCEAP